MRSENCKKTNRRKLTDITLVSLFAALCYISLMLFFIPFANMYIHFGNLIVVVASLLIGGLQGGLAGSIGMGFYDIFNGHADSAPKTFILKLLIGITVGVVYNFLKNRKSFPSLSLYLSGVLSLIIGAGLLTYTYTKNNAFVGRSAILCPVFLIIGLFCILFGLLKSKFSQKTASAIIGAFCGMLVNIIGETVWKIFTFKIAGSSLTAAVSGAVLTQSSTLINAGIAIIGGVFLFCLLEKPFLRVLKK